MGKLIGIDLGTTNSVVAVVDGPRPRVLDNRENKSQTPSVVGLKKRKNKVGKEETEVLIGEVGLANWLLATSDTIISIKRLMGRGIADSEVQRVKERYQYKIVQPTDGTKDSVSVIMGDKEYSPIDISAMILRKLKEDAEDRVNDKVTHAVITVPAYFSQIQRDATRKAGLKAGLKVMRILDEPTAAAIAFGIDSENSNDPKNLLVYDLGGGTFDISVLMWAGNAFAPLNLEGDMWLGGDDFDQVIIDHVVNYIEREHGINPRDQKRFMVELKIQARAAKERLSSSRSTDVIVPGLLHEGDLADVSLEITREEFERMIKPLVDKSVQLTKKAIENAGLTVEQIDYVLMAGNATCVPLVQKAMEEMFTPAKVLRRVHPKHSVAFGAAIMAEKCKGCDESLNEDNQGVEIENTPDIQIGGIAPFSYGTQSSGDQYNVFIDKSDPYPTPKEKCKTLPFCTRLANQRMIRVPVYGGDNIEKASLNELQGQAFAILPPGLPKGTDIFIKLWLDGDGVFKLEANLGNGTDLHPWVLQGREDQKAVESIEGVIEKLNKIQINASADQKEEIEKVREEIYSIMQERTVRGTKK